MGKQLSFMKGNRGLRLETQEGSPAQRLSGPNLGHSICHPGLASGCSLRWPRSALPTVPGSPPGSHLGLGPWALALGLGLLRPPITASVRLPFLQPLLLAWGPSGPPPLGCLWKHVCREQQCQGHQGAGTDRPRKANHLPRVKQCTAWRGQEARPAPLSVRWSRHDPLQGGPPRGEMKMPHLAQASTWHLMSAQGQASPVAQQ